MVNEQVVLYSSITSANKGWGVLVCADSAGAGEWGVQNYGKHADIILERSQTPEEMAKRKS